MFNDEPFDFSKHFKVANREYSVGCIDFEKTRGRHADVLRDRHRMTLVGLNSGLASPMKQR